MIVSKRDGHEIDLQDLVYVDTSEKAGFLWLNLVEVLLERKLISEEDVIKMTWNGIYAEVEPHEPS